MKPKRKFFSNLPVSLLLSLLSWIKHKVCTFLHQACPISTLINVKALDVTATNWWSGRKIYACWLYAFFISLRLFYLWLHRVHRPSVTLQFMALQRNCWFNSRFGLQIRHSSGVWLWQVFYFLCDCLNWEKSACLSAAVIIFPWNNIQKTITTRYFFLVN